MKKRFLIKSRWLKNQLGVDGIKTIVTKADGHFLQGLVPKLIVKAQMYIFGDGEMIFRIGNTDLIQSWVK